MGGDSCSKGREFESWHHILDGHFSHLFVVKIVMCVWKDENKWKRGRGWPIFFIKVLILNVRRIASLLVQREPIYYVLSWSHLKTSLELAACKLIDTVGGRTAKNYCSLFKREKSDCDSMFFKWTNTGLFLLILVLFNNICTEKLQTSAGFKLGLSE